MKTTHPAAAVALATLYTREIVNHGANNNGASSLLLRSWNHLTPAALQILDQALQDELLLTTSSTDHHNNYDDDNDDECTALDCHVALAQVCIRRITHQCLDKYARASPPPIVEEALKHYVLPDALQEELHVVAGRYSSAKPQTWYDALEQLKVQASSCSTTTTKNGVGVALLDKGHLWRLLLNHPMTSYVPVQCQSCGHVIPDETQPHQTDEAVGLREVSPSTVVGQEEVLELRAGWFRGPRSAVIFELTCVNCGATSHWYRSSHARVILNPNKWGRLCGEQEDLRLALAQYLNVPVRIVVPLDWDHVWSEYQSTSTSTTSSSTVAEQQQQQQSTSTAVAAVATWQVQDDSARNFACRLDEGIGHWTRVLAIHPDLALCQDVTDAYLSCQSDGGRADDCHHNNMARYREWVQQARQDASAASTQAKTLHGYVLHRAGMTDQDITQEMQRAAQDYGNKQWWQLL